MASVWVLAYHANNDETANGPLGVYSTPDLAHAAGIQEVKRDPNLRDKPIEWPTNQKWFNPSWASYFVQEFEIDEEPEPGD